MERIAIADIYPNPDQPRVTFDPAELSSLARSLTEQGQWDPCLVTPRHEGYMLVAGERRWRAAQQAGLTHLDCTVREMTDEQVAEVAIFENIQRVDLHPLEEGRAFAKLKRFGHTELTISKRSGKSRSYVRDRLNLCALSSKIDDMPQTRFLTLGQLTPVAHLGDPAIQAEAVRAIVSKGLDVRGAARWCISRHGNGPTSLSLDASGEAPTWAREREASVRKWASHGGGIVANLRQNSIYLSTSTIQELHLLGREIERLCDKILEERKGPPCT